ncbi:hypothetical protein AVL55_16195 [Alteromonas macleodii]|uniref:Type I restriction modification DNA specificity domain-containing protein n=2 Tax=Alteromonas TaxID=226 RepID=A0A126Q547_ALTMA|nr:restriction endonuclease subunit S [Alteromonas macleodii]AMJ99558.1 hypothetical protein AVL55_16195 [Alteromonas macleodii]
MEIVTPKIRFPSFLDSYKTRRVENILSRVTKPVELEDDKDYFEIGVRAWGKGIFHKERTSKKEIGNKRVFWVQPDLFIVNIVFAWEQAIAKTTQDEAGRIASHRFPMYEVVDANLDYIIWYFLTNRGRHLLGLASPGGAGRNKTLGQKDFNELRLNLPSLREQEKVADCLNEIDKRLSLLNEKLDLLEQYKKGVMQKLFKQEIRFKDEIGNDFSDWQWKQGNEVFDAISNKNHNSDLPILAITQEYGAIPRDLINYQVQVTDGSVASYKVVEKGDYIISLRSFQGGIEYSRYRGICSPAYIILRPSISIDDDFYRYYLKTGRFIQEMKRRLEGIRDGKILSYKYFSEIKLPFPCIEEQRKISHFINTLDKKLSLVKEQIELTQTFKKGLLQQMFV